MELHHRDYINKTGCSGLRQNPFEIDTGVRIPVCVDASSTTVLLAVVGIIALAVYSVTPLVILPSDSVADR